MRHLGARALAATLVIAPPLAILLWLSGAVALPAAAAVVLPFVFVVTLAGLLLLRVAGAGDMPAAAAWVLGAFATALAVYAMSWCFAWTAAAAFTVWAIAVAALALLQRAAPAEPWNAADFAGLALCAAATLAWCWDVAAAPPRLARGEPLFAWIDFLIHGGVISQFGDPRAVGRGSIDLVDFPAPLYHYASYALPAVFAVPLDLPGLPLATSVWLPLGFLTMCAGAYALGAALAGPAGGVAAVVALTLAPDAASYGLHNGLFGYRFNVIGSPGASYAVGFSLLALAFLRRWSLGGGRRALLAALVLVTGTAFVRVHVFALAFPAVLAAAALAMPVVRRRLPLFAAAALAALAMFTFAFYAMVPSAVPALESSLDLMHGDFSAPTAYMEWYPRLMADYGPGLAVPAGILLMFAASLGALVVLYPLSAWLARRVQGSQPTDLVPAAFLACYLALLVAAPVPPNGDTTELTHRPFVILYAVLAIWTATALLARVPAAGGRRGWLALLALAALALSLIWPHTRTLGAQPGFKWGWDYYALRVVDGLPQAAAFLRANAQPGDVFATREVTLNSVDPDIATELVALSGVPAYLGRADRHVSRGGSREQVARQRYAALTRIAREQDAAASARGLRELGIQWYVVAGSGPLWDRGRQRAAFIAGSLAVYSTR